MKAAVLTGPNRIETVDDWPEPVCGPHDVIVRMVGVGLCGTDLAVFHGKRLPPATPWVMGHEGFGRIAAVGSDVRDRQVGQRVVIEPNYACLKCADCLTGLTSACPHRAIVGLNAPGVLAERVALPAHFAHPVPDGLTGADLAATEPYTVARAAVRRSGVTPADRCLVVGAGAQGLLVCLILARLGIRPVVTEPHPQRLARAERLGATPDDGRTGFTYVFETSGHAPALRPAVDRAAPGATLVLIGLNPHQLPLTTDDVVRRQLVLRGSMIYDHPGDFTTAIAELPAARPGAVIEARFSLEKAQQAFAGAAERAGKTWISIAEAEGCDQDA
ncbi:MULTISPECIES: zinc-dependent alcohol dehydrogenase [Streptomyces]|uniref:L-threonine 3-dehydrogenase n=1 Tax=Streptomyces chartreusis NRRL 3882 TaxID=1079985 RepID=A0A2N9BAD0_STRCX|nr:alcohol dehydrogenase catalytic domain-containing protein [Streptomyces chartreusis]MYS91211.1 alcohol dehydrogenase catalytic domain-containing protein [Streptomyces sp. SID5464]SOR80306.1 L-threonine 3-dehydrogenase [Streptomyces chartreusis NRRL 3882]